MNTEADTVYLCQVGPEISCGACCGLYNVADPSPAYLEAMLTRRTKWFESVPRTVEGIDDFKQKVENAEPRERPFPDFHHCPYLGMIEDAGRRVGCLLHPLAHRNNGVDFRGMSYYGGMACRTYFCPSVKKLPSRWLAAIRQSMDHWHLLGLIVTERKLLTRFFTELENRLHRPVGKRDFHPGSGAASLLRSFAGLKSNWPYKREGAPGPCNYFFEDGLYQRPKLIGHQREGQPAGVEKIFVELDTGFSSEKEMRAAEEIIEAIFERIVRQLKNSRGA